VTGHVTLANKQEVWMHLVTRTVATTFTAAMIAASVLPAAADAATGPASTPGGHATVSSVPDRNPDRCNSSFYRLRHHFYCKHHRQYR
jgi:hypothetical protein